MILDERLEFADATSVIHAAGTVLLGDVIDLGAQHRDVGNGQDIFLYITVDTSVITAGAAGTISFSLVSDAQAAIAVDGSATVHWKSKDFVTDDTGQELTLGYLIGPIALPNEKPIYERYLGLIYTVTTTATSAGAVSAGLTFDKAGWQSYAQGVN